ncbi:zf-HC2 domain-containing protein [Marinobacterium arenosum]|uniref:zf-HC2 domain-containing protein n=1 Tax=Marinobacterium arenosum TaxID=2862496 RepID=UPI001C9805B8|nr:zf-HC2 domain-containing protein [Marinobacterium arenosum]MBY4676995.1 zf-HC2 domain-containing protein [Marinobacterium arenosum]
MMNCKQATKLMSDAQERPLTPKERIALRMHVMLCSGCRNFGKQMHSLRDMARQFAKGREQDDSTGSKS